MSSVELASAYVSIIPSVRGIQGKIGKALAPGQKEAEQAGKRQGSRFAGAFKASIAGLGGALAAVGIGKFVADAVTGAGELEQSIGAIESVFGKSSGKMQKWSKNAATNVGLTKNEFNELGTLIGAQLKNGGTAMDKLAPKTKNLIGVGADLASMFGGTTKEAVGALSSALKGERDPIEAYGVSLNQAKIDAEAASLGFKKVEGNLSAEAQQAATLSLIMKQTTDAHGNFAKEADTFAGAQQRMNAQWGNLVTEVGGAVIPVMTKLFKWISDTGLPALRRFGGWVKNDVVPALKSMGQWIRDTGLPAVKSFGQWFVDNGPTIAKWAGVITAVMLPVLLRLAVRFAAAGTAAVVSSVKQVGAWVASQAAAVKAGVVHVVQSYRVVASWVRMAAAAVVSGAQTVAIWAMYKWEAIKAAAVYVAQSFRVAAAWVRMSAAAVLSGVKTAAVWTGQVVKAAVVGAAKFAVQVGRVVAGWTLMAARSLVMAARMAASWIIALGPIAWVTAAVIAIVALVIANWDKIKKWTVKIFKAVWGFLKDTWKNIKATVKFVVNWVAAHVKAKLLWLKAQWHRIWTTIKNFLSDTWDNIKATVRTVINWVVGWVKDRINTFKSNWNRIWNGVKKIISDAWGGIKNAVRNSWEFIRDRVFGPLKKFITKTIPNAFERGVKGIKGFWSKLQDIAKKPVKFVIQTVLNNGLIKAFNSVMDFIGSDIRVPKIKLPRGFRKGGYTGDGPAHEAAGIVHKGEYVLTKEQTRALGGPKGAAAMAANGAGGFSPIWGGFQNAIRSAGQLFVGTGAGSAWNIPGAASMWDRLAGLRVRAGRGTPQATTGLGPLGSILAWATGSGNITFNTGGLAPGLSPVMKTATAAHEIGHVLGLPHTMGASIMQPTIGKYMAPTAMDKRRLESLYGEGSRAPGGGGFNPLKWIADKITSVVSGLIDKIPGAGKFFDIAVSVGKYLFEKAKDWALDKITGPDARDKGTSTGTNKFGQLHDNGGKIGLGTTLIDNQSRKPEALLNSRQWSTAHRAIQHVEQQANGTQFPSVVRLVVGDREFDAYVDTRAVAATGGALNSADNRLRFGGKYVGGLV